MNMKKLFLLLIICSTTAVFSQDWRDGLTFLPATVTSDYCVQLDAGQPVAEWYIMDITHMDFANQTEAQQAFWMRQNNLVSYTVILDEHKAYAHIHLDRTSTPQDIVWWNDFLNSLCEH